MRIVVAVSFVLLALVPVGASITAGSVEAVLGGTSYTSGSTFAYSPYSTYSVGIVAYAKSDNPSCDVAWMRVVYSIDGVDQSPDALSGSVNVCPSGWQIIGQGTTASLKPGINRYTLTMNGNFWGATYYTLQPVPTPTPTPYATPYAVATPIATAIPIPYCVDSTGAQQRLGTVFTVGSFGYRCNENAIISIVLDCSSRRAFEDGAGGLFCETTQLPVTTPGAVFGSGGGGGGKPSPGFEAVFAIAGLLAVAYLIKRKGE